MRAWGLIIWDVVSFSGRGSGFVFPEGEVPAPIPMAGGTLIPLGVPLSDFIKLTKIPIIIYYGDNIPEKPMDNPGQDGWRARLEMALLLDLLVWRVWIGL